MTARKYPSFDRLASTCEKIAARLENGGDEVAIAGGLAMHIYGSPRLTNDVDLIATSPGNLPFKKRLTFGGVRGRVGTVDVDVIVRDDDYEEVYTDALAKAVKLKGWSTRVVRPAHLVAMKMIARRPKDEQDLMFILTTAGAVTIADCRKVVLTWLGRYGLDDLNSLINEAEWRKTRE